MDPGGPQKGSTTDAGGGHTLTAVDAISNTSNLLAWLMTALVVATALAGVAVVVCAVAVVAARLRNGAPATASDLNIVAAGSLRSDSADDDPAGSGAATTPSHGRSGPARSAAVPSEAETRRPQLPVGAEAALNAIVELRPDPRNVVVTHRDPTGEVRLYPMGAANDANNRLERSA